MCVSGCRQKKNVVWALLSDDDFGEAEDFVAKEVSFLDAIDDFAFHFGCWGRYHCDCLVEVGVER